MMLHHSSTRRSRPGPSSVLLIFYLSSPIFTVQAAFGDRLPLASVPGLSYLPPTQTDTDSTLTLPSSTSHQRVPTAATNDALRPGVGALGQGTGGVGAVAPSGAGSGEEGALLVGSGTFGTGQGIGTGGFGTGDVGGTGDFGIGVVGGTGGTEVGGADGFGTGDLGGTSGFGTGNAGGLNAGEVGGFGSEVGGAEVGATGLGQSSGVELGQTGGAGLEGAGDGTLAESSETREVQTGSDADDGIPGRAGVDYPTLAAVPNTGFSCRNYDLPGYYVDQEAQCQVFYICQVGGRQDGFLCPNGTMFNQQFLVCDWWYNVDCSLADSHFSINERIYAGPGSRAVIFPDEDVAETQQGQQQTFPVDESRQRPSETESIRSGSDGGDASLVADDVNIVAPTISADYGDYDTVSGDYDAAGSHSDGQSLTTDGVVIDSVGGTQDYDVIDVTDDQSTGTPLGITLDGGDVSLRDQDSYYSYLPPDQDFAGEEASAGSFLSPAYGVPLDLPVDAATAGPLPVEASEQVEDVTAYSSAPTEEATGTPTVPFGSDEIDALVTSSSFDDSTIEEVLSDAGNLGGLPDNSGYSYPEPLNPLGFQSFRTTESPATVGTRTFADESTTILATDATTSTDSYSYSPPSTGGFALASNRVVTTTPSPNRRVNGGRVPQGYSYPEPSVPFLLPGETVLPPSETYLPPPTS